MGNNFWLVFWPIVRQMFINCGGHFESSGHSQNPNPTYWYIDIYWKAPHCL